MRTESDSHIDTMTDPLDTTISDPRSSRVADDHLVPDSIEPPVHTGEVSGPRVWPWTRLVLWSIRGYQRVMAGRPSPCRFTPSCSTYATEALQIHGLVKGSGLAVWRLLRCNPWGGQGFDPVPARGHHRSRSSSPECSHHQHHNHHKAN